MRTGKIAWAIGAVVATIAAGAVVGVGGAFTADPPAGSKFTKADYFRWTKEHSNWGRWGKDDEMGTLNLITAAKRKQAAALVKSGVTVSLAELQIPNGLNKEDPNTAPPFRATWNFKEGYEAAITTDDWTAPPAEDLALSSHGSRSHIDALAHNFYRGQYYNGFSWKEITKDGAKKGGIQNLRHGIVTRGILMDIPRLKGVPYLQNNERIYIADLEAWEKKAGVKVSSGDALFIRVGHWARRRATGDKTPAGRNTAGLDPSVSPWLRQRDVAVIGTEAAIDLLPSGFTGKRDDMPSHPVHYFTNVFLGMTILDWLELEALAEMAAKENRWEFMLMAAPLPVQGGTGSPINPIGVF